MSLLQLYYTSCEEGLSSGKGFQVNAASPELDSSLFSTVQRAGAYSRPDDAPSCPAAEELDAFPLSLVYQHLPGAGFVCAQSRYVGLDFTGTRYGNYFLHALFSPDGGMELPARPIDLWRHPLWVSRPTDRRELPAVTLPSLLPAHERRASIAQFLSKDGRLERLPDLVGAVQAALQGPRRVIMVDTSDAVAGMIGAVSHLLPASVARTLTFNTYHHEPKTVDAVITGTTGEFRVFPGEMEHTYFLFDVPGGRFSPPPAATPLTDLVSAACASGDLKEAHAFVDFVEHRFPSAGVADLNELSAYFAATRGPVRAGGPALFQWMARRLDALDEESLTRAIKNTLGVKEVGGDPAMVAPLGTLYAEARKRGDSSPPCRLLDEVLVSWLGWMIGNASPEQVIEAHQHLKPPARVCSRLAERHRKRWIDRVKDTTSPLEACHLLAMGHALGFEAPSDKDLQDLGMDVLGPALGTDEVSRYLMAHPEASVRAALLRGVAEHLNVKAGETSGAAAFQALAPVLGRPDWSRPLLEVASHEGFVPLYFRLTGIAVASTPTERVAGFRRCLAQAERHCSPTKPGHVEAAYQAVFARTPPTVAEALQLLEAPAPGPSPAMVDGAAKALESEADFAGLPEAQVDLATRLQRLKNRSAATGAILVAVELKSRGWSTSAQKEAYRVLGACTGKVKDGLLRTVVAAVAAIDDSDPHRRAVEQGYSQLRQEFLAAYSREVERILAKADKMRPQRIAFLFDAWARDGRALQQEREPWSSLLDETLPRALARIRGSECDSVGHELEHLRGMAESWAAWRKRHRSGGLFGWIRRLVGRS